MIGRLRRADRLALAGLGAWLLAAPGLIIGLVRALDPRPAVQFAWRSRAGGAAASFTSRRLP